MDLGGWVLLLKLEGQPKVALFDMPSLEVCRTEMAKINTPGAEVEVTLHDYTKHRAEFAAGCRWMPAPKPEVPTS